MMDAKLKRKWVKALRSGEYLQGRGQLVSDDGKNFCCLGVLADVMGCEWQESTSEFCSTLVPILPRGRKPLAIRGEDFLSVAKTRLRHNVQGKLASMNDDGASFKKIAQFIEDEI